MQINKEKIIEKMDNKRIKKQHQQYILKYIELNTKLFPFLDIQKLTQRLVENFCKITPNIMSIIYQNLGQYSPTTGNILIAPNLYYGKNKKYKETVIMHELDHCACTPTKIKQQYNQYKKQFNSKHKILHYLVPNIILSETFFYKYDAEPISGIANFKGVEKYTKQKILTGTNWTKHLNEGITSLKQIIYSKELGIQYHYDKDFYFGARKAVKCLIKIIGFENLINLHFNNNLQEIEKQFNNKVKNITLEELTLKCLIYDNNRTKRNLEKVEETILQIEKSRA